MSNHASAMRYAKALFDVALKEANPEQVDKDLAGVAELFAQHAELRRSLTHPAVPVSAKRAGLEALTPRLTSEAPLAKLLLMLADRDRFELLPDLAAAYRERLMDHLNVVRAELVTTDALSDDRAAQLEQRLSQATGRTVTMTRRVDPGILGGVVARIGSTVYDGSIATHLARMRERLVVQR